MIDFSTLKELTIPEGAVIQISNNATILWERPGLLPSAYQQVEYIQTDGNQAIDTGIKVTGNTDNVNVEIHIIVVYGMNINAIAASITEKVRYAVKENTGITVNKVVVKVDGIKEE